MEGWMGCFIKVEVEEVELEVKEEEELFLTK